jgi:hypothetical protein
MNLKVHYRVHKSPPPQNVAVEWLEFLIPFRANPDINPSTETVSPELGLSWLVGWMFG